MSSVKIETSAAVKQRLPIGLAAEEAVKSFVQNLIKNYNETKPKHPAKIFDTGPYGYDIYLFVPEDFTEGFLTHIGYLMPRPLSSLPQRSVKKNIRYNLEQNNDAPGTIIIIEVKTQNAQLSKAQRNIEEYQRHHFTRCANSKYAKQVQEIKSYLGQCCNEIRLLGRVNMPKYKSATPITASFCNLEHSKTRNSQRKNLKNITLLKNCKELSYAYYHPGDIGRAGEKISAKQPPQQTTPKKIHMAKTWEILGPIKKDAYNSDTGIDNVWIRKIKLPSQPSVEFEIRFIEVKTTTTGQPPSLSKRQKLREKWVNEILESAANPSNKGYTEATQKQATRLLNLINDQKAITSFQINQVSFQYDKTRSTPKKDRSTIKINRALWLAPNDQQNLSPNRENLKKKKVRVSLFPSQKNENAIHSKKRRIIDKKSDQTFLYNSKRIKHFHNRTTKTTDSEFGFFDNRIAVKN